MVKIGKSKINWGYVYILKGIQTKGQNHGKTIYYIGCTRRELHKRLDEHYAGLSKYTSRLRDISLVYYFIVPVVNMFSVEHYLKVHRYIVYSFVEKKGFKRKGVGFKNPKIERKFFSWCKSQSINIIESGKIDVIVKRGMMYATTKLQKR